jgi:hypothetical protein
LSPVAATASLIMWCASIPFASAARSKTAQVFASKTSARLPFGCLIHSSVSFQSSLNYSLPVGLCTICGGSSQRSAAYFRRLV